MLFNGLRVLDASTAVAGPLAAGLLGDFGADVIKIEDPVRGEPSRAFLPQKNGIALGHKVTNRNKQNVALNLRDERGRELLRRLSTKCDVVVINVRTETLAEWRLDYEDLCQARGKDDLVMLHVTGFGRTGPYRNRPGFNRVAEAFGGLLHFTGFPDGPPIPAGYPIVDAMTGVFGALGVTMALYERQQTGRGQLIDLALYESLLRVLEDFIVEYDQTGHVRERVGTANPFVAPNDLYRCGDRRWVILPTSTPPQFERLCEAIGHPELVHDERFRTNALRVEHRAELDEWVEAFMEHHTADDVGVILDEHGVAYGKVLNVAEIVADLHVQARGNIVKVWDDDLGGELAMQAPVPRLSRTPGAIRFPSRQRGADTVEVFRDVLGCSAEEIEHLRGDGVI